MLSPGKKVVERKVPVWTIIDSRSVKTSHHVNSDRGINGNKKIKGRKEYILVDKLGLPLGLAIHKTNLHDSKGVPKVLKKSECKFPKLKKKLTDGGY